MQKWEYKFELFILGGEREDAGRELSLLEDCIKDAIEQLNESCNEGWELVSMIPEIGKHNPWGIAVLKRPKQ